MANAAEQRITVGRVVHYYPRLGVTPVPAITCGVEGDGSSMVADLFVMDPARWAPTGGAARFAYGVPFSEEPRAECWTWQPIQRAQRPPDARDALPSSATAAGL